MCQKNPLTKRPHFADQAAGHHKCPKIMPQNIYVLLKSRLDIKTCFKNPATKRPHFAKQPAGHHKWVQNFCDKSSKFCFRKGWIWCHKALWGGCMLCHMWQTVHLEAGEDEKYLDGSDRWKNVTVVNCHSRRFVGWTDSVGWIVAWLVCGWMDRQGTEATMSWVMQGKHLTGVSCFKTYPCGNTKMFHVEIPSPRVWDGSPQMRNATWLDDNGCYHLAGW